MRVIVIGGGIAGLGAATYFARKGHAVEVLEAGSRTGGRSLTVTSRRGDRVDAGTQYFHTNYVRARGLLREIGLYSQLRKIAGHTRFFDERVRRGFFDVSHRLPWFPPAGVKNLKATMLVGRVLATRANAFGIDYRPALDAASAWATLGDPAVREFALRPLLLAGALTEPMAAQPSMLHVLRLLRIIVLTDYQVLPQGIASFAEGLAARLRVSLDSPVRRLVVEGGAVVGVEREGNGRIERADHIVVAVPPPAAAVLLPESWDRERRYLQGITIPPFTLVTLFLDRPLQQRIWSYMLPQNGGSLVHFVTDVLRKSPGMVPSGKSVLQAWVCYPASQKLVGMSDDDVTRLCCKELERYFDGLSSWIEEVRVTRHPFAVPFHGVGHQTATVEFLRRVESRQGVSFCGDYLSGGFMEAALWSAERAAERRG